MSSAKKNKKIKEQRIFVYGCILAAAILVMGIVTFVMAARIQVIPLKFLALGSLIFLIPLAVVAFNTFTVKGYSGPIISTIISVAMLALTIVLCKNMSLTMNTLQQSMDVHTETMTVSLYVDIDDPAQTFNDTAGYTFGILSELDRKNTDTVINDINSTLGTNIAVKEYADITSLADAMIAGEVNAMLVNEGYIFILQDWNNMVEEAAMDESISADDIAGMSATDYSAFVDRLRKLTEYSIEIEVAGPAPEQTGTPSNAASGNAINDSGSNSGELGMDGNVSPDPDAVQDDGVPAVQYVAPPVNYSYNYKDTGSFIIYISGQDSWGGVYSSSRSDVNILAVVNMNTHKMLLVSTPRDYYVPLSVSNGARDKLTHAGIYGVSCSRDTLEMLYGYDVPYFVKLNFSGFQQIIDALGGIEVWSDYDFTVEGVKHYTPGNNYLNGIEALAFARERYALPGGDNARGHNQMNVIISTINKMSSSAMLANYSKVLASTNGAYITDMPYDVVASLISDQLGSGSGWDIRSYAVYGSGAFESTYSAGAQKLYVMYPNMESVAEAKRLIQATLDGTL